MMKISKVEKVNNKCKQQQSSFGQNGCRSTCQPCTHTKKMANWTRERKTRGFSITQGRYFTPKYVAP